MMQKFPLIFGFVFLLAASEAAQAKPFPCPEKIALESAEAKSAEGFEGFYDSSFGRETHALSWVQLFDGHPKEMASLKPDNGDEVAAIYRWTNLGGGWRDFWMVCYYQDTHMTYARNLGKSLDKCQTMVDPKTKTTIGLECYPSAK